MRPPPLATATPNLLRILAIGFLLSTGQGGHSGCLQAQELPPQALAPAPGPWTEAVTQARDLLIDRMEEQSIPGLSVAVGMGGEVLWSEGFGWADLENRVPVWPETKFRVASISKALTAAAVGKLMEEGRLDLDAPVQEYLPSFPEKRWPVTTRLLGGHLAGMRHYRGLEFQSMEHYGDVVEALEIFSADTLLHEPGTAYEYSTYGWNLISAVVQSAAGEPYLDYMRKAVFEPAEMDETVAEHVDSLIYRRSRAYRRTEDDRIMNAPYVDNSNKWAGGGFLSTAPDLVRFGMAHLDGTLLRRETLETLWTSQATTEGEETGYGIGWRVATWEGRQVVYHTGGAVGGTTVLVIYPEEGLVVSLLANIQNAGQTGNAEQVAEIFLTR